MNHIIILICINDWFKLERIFIVVRLYIYIYIYDITYTLNVEQLLDINTNHFMEASMPKLFNSRRIDNQNQTRTSLFIPSTQAVYPLTTTDIPTTLVWGTSTST